MKSAVIASAREAIVSKMNARAGDPGDVVSALYAAQVATADFALITDAGQRIIHVSPSFTAMTGYNRDDLLGHNCRVLQGPGTNQVTRARMREALAAGKVFDGSILNYRKDGSQLWMAIKIIPLRVGTTSEISHFVSIQRDISNDAALLKQLQDQAHLDLAQYNKGETPQIPVVYPPGSQRDSLLATDPDHTNPNKYRDALRCGSIIVHYQPVVDLRDGSIHLFEALARLDLSNGRIAHPGEFLAHFGTEDLRDLFYRVLERALATIAGWQKQGATHSVSVNLPPAILADRTIVARVQKLLDAHGLPPERLGLELLETELISSEEQRTALRELSDNSVGIAIDDLGSGYSSLLRASSFPFNAMKLDQGLFHNVLERPVEALNVIATLIQLGRDLNMNVVVEGLEEESLTEAAYILGAFLGQGYYLAKPMLADDCLDWAESFNVRTYLSPIRTPLGALAFCVQFIRLALPHPHELVNCPLTKFIAEKGGSGELKLWHAQQHRSATAQVGIGQIFIDWIIPQIREHKSRIDSA